MRDYFRLRSTMQLPSTEYNFRQHLLHHDTSFIALSMNELKMIQRVHGGLERFSLRW